MVKKLVLVLVILFLLPIFASAQSTSQITPEQAPDELNKRKVERFLEAKSFKCNFENGYFSDWEDGKLQSQATKDKLSLIFDSIDYNNYTARFIGNQGASDISLKITIGGITFTEITGLGNFMTTTIFMPAAMDNNLKDQFYSVHSRHIGSFMGGPMVSQYYGQCEIWDINR